MSNITLQELAYRIIELYRSAHKDTDEISERLIQDWIHGIRAILIKQKLDKPMTQIDDDLTQTVLQDYRDRGLGPVKLEQVDSSQFFPEQPAKREMLRTAIDIPPTISRRGHIGTFTRIGPIDRLDQGYKLVDYETALVSGHGKFNRNDIYAFPLDGRIYLIGRYLRPKALLDIRGVFQNPTQIEGFSVENSPYPINRDMIDRMEGMIMESKAPMTLVGYKDTKADEADNLVQTSGQQPQQQ